MNISTNFIRSDFRFRFTDKFPNKKYLSEKHTAFGTDMSKIYSEKLNSTITWISNVRAKIENDSWSEKKYEGVKLEISTKIANKKTDKTKWWKYIKWKYRSWIKWIKPVFMRLRNRGI